MVQGIEVDLFRPDDELQASSRGSAVERDAATARRRALAAVDRRGGLARRLARRRKDPWFNFSSRQRHVQRRQGLARPPGDPARASSATTSRKLQAGEDIDRPTAADRAPSATGSRPSTARCCPTTTRAPRSTRSSGCRRLVFPYVENHNFYVEHWSLSVFWRRMRELGAGARRARASGPRPTTSSTCAATSSRRRSSTTATAGRSAPSAIGPGPLAGGDRAAQGASSPRSRASRRRRR